MDTTTKGLIHAVALAPGMVIRDWYVKSSKAGRVPMLVIGPRLASAHAPAAASAS